MFSKKLNETQKRYSAYDCELLAIHEATKHFRCMLEGQDFKILTDHKPLIFAFPQNSEKLSLCRARQLDYISQFKFTFNLSPEKTILSLTLYAASKLFKYQFLSTTAN